eukprot:3401897-Alexandrium_andersonii.AAC.1
MPDESVLAASLPAPHPAPPGATPPQSGGGSPGLQQSRQNLRGVTSLTLWAYCQLCTPRPGRRQ